MAKRLTIWIPQEVHEWLSERAEDDFSSITSLAVKALRKDMEVDLVERAGKEEDGGESGGI